MFWIECPHCQEKREELEFSFCDEAFIERPKNPKGMTDKKWAEYLFHRNNPKGESDEMWQHTYGCRKYFVLKRNNQNNQISSSLTLEKAAEQNKKSQNQSRTNQKTNRKQSNESI